MHFHSLAVVTIPKKEPNPEQDRELVDKIREAEEKLLLVPNDILARIELRHLRGLNNTFAVEVDNAIDSLMHPYGSESEDCYEFCDQKENVRSRYESGTTKAICLPDGRKVSIYDNSVWGKFVIQDGKVYETKSGKLKQTKRTHKAKKMKVISNCTYKKLYKTMHDFAIHYCDYEYDEQTQGYGYYCNPDAMWDWYQIGGRWPITFLVKNECTEYAYGERSWGNSDEEYPVPEGYKWVSAARKKDIEWNVMKEWYLQEAKKRFNALESMFVAGLLEPDKYLQVKDGYVYSYIDPIYQIGENEEAYLKRHGFDIDRKYPVSFCDLIDADEWVPEGGFTLRLSADEQQLCTWRDTIENYIEDLDDEDVLVSVDYHM